MATYVRASSGYTGVLITEAESRTTWGNIQNVIPLIADADRIKIVSHSLQAERARAHLWEQRPDLAERLVPAADYRFGEVTLIKAIMSARRLRNRRRAARRAGPSTAASGRLAAELALPSRKKILVNHFDIHESNWYSWLRPGIGGSRGSGTETRERESACGGR
jgi:hypothetical protein